MAITAHNSDEWWSHALGAFKAHVEVSAGDGDGSIADSENQP
jgi:hypothetical protein